MRIIKVDRCRVCPYCTTEPALGEDWYFCNKAWGIIHKNIDIVQKWCPLEKKESK